jgi:P-type E1-E2 ATPase
MMIELQIPGRGRVELEYAVFDVNGTLAVDGQLIEGVEPLIAQLRGKLEVRLLTADTHGKQAEIDGQLRFTADRLKPGGHEREQKAAYVRALGAHKVVAIGNGANDVDMLKTAALGIAVIGPEGAAYEALAAADVVTHHIFDAISLLLFPKRLIATLRR